MKNMFLLFLVLIVFLSCIKNYKETQEVKVYLENDDPYLWLEEVLGEKALSWVKEQNLKTKKSLESDEDFKVLESEILEVLNSKEKIPYVIKGNKYFYNFWRDEKNPRGVLRRTTFDEYLKKEPKWEVVLDIDKLNEKEQTNWVYKGIEFLLPKCEKAIISLSRGGADATVKREFDLLKKEFIEGGFYLKEAKSSISWIDENTLYVATDFGKGTLTNSGYPRIVKVLKRGKSIDEAETLFEGKETDMSIGAYYDNTEGYERHFVYRRINFYESEIFYLDEKRNIVKLDIPLDSEATVHREWLLLSLRTPYSVNGKNFKEGSLIATRFDEFMKGKREFVLLFEPTSTTSLKSFEWTKNYLILNILDNVKDRIFILTPKEGEWSKEELKIGSGYSSINVTAIDEKETDEYFLTITDFITPTSLYYGVVGEEPRKIKELPHFFDSSNLEISQHFAVSDDGTKIPYFQVSSKDLKYDGKNKTLLTGYGGFEVSLTPYYSGIVGRGWLSRGGVYVVANIRGGGEYGPKWHQSAIKSNRNRCYEDFAAVAKDLIARKVTSPKYLGIEGGSNGGLLVGNMLTKYPNLFGAVVCQVPLLDMKRYSKLLAGASWMAEYGDPDNPEEWKFIKTFSPYHNVKTNEKYPPVLFMTSTRDDRVHPGHARKMAKKMLDMGYEVFYYENIEGGHGGAADNPQIAHMWALAYKFLWKKLDG